MTVWPDADAAGLEYARQVAKLATAAGALSVAIVSPPPDCKIGWDAADALSEGWDEARAMGLINAAKPAAPEMSKAGKSVADRNDQHRARRFRWATSHSAARHADRAHRILRILARC